MEKSSFFNSVNGDRKYKASDFAEYFNSLVTNGVFPNPSTNLQVIANNNMTVTVKSGKAWINGYVYINDSDLVLNIDVADGVLNRIDRLVLRMDTIERNITAKVKKGTFASTPVAPTLQRDADAYELGIADIYVTKGAVSIVQANITDLRLNTDLCGVVNSLIQADTTSIFNQYLDWYNSKTSQYQTDMSNMELQFLSDFNTWFDSIKNTLSGDVAGNLLNMINEIVNQIGVLSTLNTTDKSSVVNAINENKANIITNANNLASHLADDVKHITSAERTTWNAKQSALGYTPLNKAGDTATGIITAQSNTSYTTRQVHNMILSPNDADVNAMQNGDIWIKYV